MRSLAEYVMSGRRQAVIAALLFSFFPLLGWIISCAIMALVTLRKGAKEGSIVFLWLILPAVIFTVLGYKQVWIYDILGTTLFVYLLALILRASKSWNLVLQTGIVIGIISVVIVHIAVPDIAEWWRQTWLISFTNLKQQFNWAGSDSNIQQVAQFMAQIATGMQVAILLLGNLVSLAIARWWQSLLYNPGGLAAELRNIRVSLITVLALAFGLLGWFIHIAWIIDSLPLILLPFLIAAYSLLHYLVANKRLSVWWLVVCYILVVISFPYFAIGLSVLGLLDYYWNFRQRFSR